MWNFIKNLFKQPTSLGAKLDTRPQSAKDQDWTHEEVGGATSINWIEKPEYKFYEKRWQNGALTCGAQTAARLLRVEALKTGFSDILSALPIYWKRTTAGSGMTLFDVLNNSYKYATTTEARVPSQNMHEAQSNQVIPLSQVDADIAAKLKVAGFVKDVRGIDNIAAITEQGKGVALLIFFSGEEWNGKFEVQDQNLGWNDYRALHHFVTATDYTLINGKKYLVIEDSAYAPNRGQALMSEEFVNKRIYIESNGAVSTGYLLDQIPQTFKFTKDLKFGMTDQDVKFLQKRLNVIQTSYFGPLTLAAVKAYQTAHGIPSTGYVGPLTRASLNA